MLDVVKFFASEFDEHQRAIAEAREVLQEPFGRALAIWANAIRNGGKILFFGNGGSAGDAQHLATELTIRYSKNRRPIAAIALTTDTSALTAAGNDMGFDHIFSRQLEALGRKDDVAVGISTSGCSCNVIEALRSARDMGLATMALGGGSGGLLREHADIALIVPCATTARIQELHIMIGQMLCGALELELGLI